MGRGHGCEMVLWATWVLWVNLGGSLGFNIETEDIVIHTGPQDSKFGFSLAQHRDTAGNWILVGAPEAETQQRGVTRGGAVYRCHPAVTGNCTQIPFDLTGDHWESGRQVDKKSMQWFGASVSSSSGVIVACAPRYVWFSVKQNRREPVGNCFISTGRDSQTFQMYSPCMTRAWGYHRQGSCQAGFGTTLTQNGNRLYVGAVGSYYWQGQVFYQDLLNRQEALSTGEGPQRDDMSYLGYSITSGDFTGDGEEDVAVGMPRGNDLKGQVVIMDDRLGVVYNITGEQLGSYFGYSLTAGDVDGDGLADVVVGAPWTSPVEPRLYEVGAVYVFTQTQQHNFQRSAMLEGDTSRGHFGVSVAFLGDLNLDGFGDLAVGAPYGGPSGSGAVYVFLGGTGGVSTTPSQVLLSEALTQGRVGTFGWSLAAGQDLDGNEYPDLVVGGYQSNSAVVFRTRPVVQAQATLKFKSESGIMDLETLECSLQDGSEVACVSLQYCLSYTGYRVPPRLMMEVALRVDMQAELSPRMFFLLRERQSTYNTTVELRKEVENCTTIYTYISSEVHDKLNPLVAELKSGLGEGGGVGLGELRPILAPTKTGVEAPHTRRATIYIKNNCGVDNVCVPDLVLALHSREVEYVVGSLENLELVASVSNSGEDAFQARVSVRVPQGATFSRFLVLGNTAPDVTPFCSINHKTQHQEVVCEVGNPLPGHSNVTMQLDFQPIPQLMNDTALEFHVTASSASEEDEGDADDNHVALALPITVRSDIDIRGISWPEGRFDYNTSRFGSGLVGEDGKVSHERQAGPEVMHIYDVTNFGPSHLPEATLYLLWPTRTMTNDPLLYLLEPPLVTPPAHCYPVSDVNYLGLEIETPSYENFVDLQAERAEERKSEIINEVLKEKQHRRKRHSHSHSHNQEHGGRWKREVVDPQWVEAELGCGASNCTRVVCKTTLRAGGNVVVRVRSRLWVDTMEKLDMSEVKISSRLVVVGGGVGGAKGSLWAKTVTSVVRVGPPEHQRSIKWLVIAGSVLAGLLLLAVLSVLLWAMGFFKRKRPSNTMESEPLSSNGYYRNGKS